MRRPVPALTPPDRHPQQANAASIAADTRLDGLRLRAARIFWLVLAAFCLVLFAVDLPIYSAALHTVCTGTLCPSPQLTPAGARLVARLGISLNTYAALVTADTLVVMLIFCAVAVFLAWRRSDDWMALLVAYMLLAVGTGLVYGSLAVPNPALRFLDSLLSFVAFAPALFLVFYVFPQGRFTPRWLGWAILVTVLVEAGNNLFTGTPLDVNYWVPNLENFFFFGILAALAGAQIYRYRRVYTPVQRQQSKWVIFSLAIFAAFGLVIYALGPFISDPGGLGGSALAVVAPLIFVNVFALLFPVSFAVAVLRYRLWDIDLIINRTLVYGSLTALLAAVYFATIIALQALSQALTGNHKPQPVPIVASTLLIAALVAPLRRGLQAAIDRRFYRRKYDAARTLAAFAASLRTELDLGQLTQHLITAADETMQPAHISLWLRPSRPHTPEATVAPQQALDGDSAMHRAG